jgi:hypothetical protein
MNAKKKALRTTTEKIVKGAERRIRKDGSFGEESCTGSSFFTTIFIPIPIVYQGKK